MTAQEFLNNGPIDVKYIAAKMWPTNKNANVYLSMKLNGKRPWTVDDESKASKLLLELGNDLVRDFK